MPSMFLTRQSKLGVKLFQRREGGRFSAVVLVPVHVKNFLAGDRQESGQDALGEAGAEDDAVVLLIHSCGDQTRVSAKN